MSTGEMQACLARLYVDEPFRRLLYLDPQAALVSYRLTPKEDAAIRDIDRDSLDRFAASLIAKRRKPVERAYPLLFRIDGKEIRRYYARFYQLYAAKPYQAGHQEIINFGTFVEESAANAEHLPAYASDLARYERLYYSTRVATLSDADPPGQSQAEPQPVVQMNARPSLSPHVTIAIFAHDVGAIEEALQNGEAPAEIHAGSHCCIIFRPGNSDSSVQMLRINAPTKIILDCCDGRRTLAQIVTDTEVALGACDLCNRIIESIHRLLASHVLVIDDGGGAHAQVRHPGYASSTQFESM
jgi:hypothetical protein